MPLKLFDSLSGTLKEFKPLSPEKVLIYVCGITPYDTTHLGHAFTYTIFDVLIRYLKFLGYQVTYTQNITDIDDDILKKASEVGRDWKELGEYWTEKFVEDCRALNLLPPNNYIKATDAIPEIIEIVQKLITDSFAYEGNPQSSAHQKEGNIYFEISKFPKYGKLSKFSPEQMLNLSRERGANPDDPLKKAPLDFLLWQKSKEEEPSWNSPWGLGRPGWHIECSAMIYKTLGPQIDIHGGGLDLIYPHHESEVAQSESYTHKSPFAGNWMHIAMLEYQGEKMSKSLGNLVMVSDLLKKYSPNAIRWTLLSHHYRSSWSFEENELEKSEETIKNILNRIEKSSDPEELDAKTFDQVKNLLNNDLNIPEVLKFLPGIRNIRTLKEIFLLLGFDSK